MKITKKDILDIAVHTYFEGRCTVEEAVKKAQKEFSISDKDLVEIMGGFGNENK